MDTCLVASPDRTVGLAQKARSKMAMAWYSAGVALTMSVDAFAGLEAKPNLSGNDYVEQGYEATKAGSTFLINIVMAAVFIAFVVVMMGEWSTFRKEHKLGNFLTHGIIGLVLTVLSLFFLNTAKTTMA